MSVTAVIFSSSRVHLHRTLLRHYAVKAASPSIAGLGKKSKDKGAAAKKVEIEVETDTHKLVNYVCGSNIMQTGEDIQLKPDNEYPEWLWNINTGPPKKLSEMEPGSKEYLETLKRINIIKATRLRVLSKIKQQ